METIKEKFEEDYEDEEMVENNNKAYNYEEMPQEIDQNIVEQV